MHIPDIVIVGGGAGGLELATALGHKLGKKKRANITLVDQSLTHVWKPLYHAIAAGTLDIHQEELNYIVHAHQHGFAFKRGQLQGLDRDQKHIHLRYHALHESNKKSIETTLRYDYLVIAIGSVAWDFNIPGVKEHCHCIDTLYEAKQFHRHLLNKMISPKTVCEHQPTPTVIIGGGATGVELSAELRHAWQQASGYTNQDATDSKLPKLTVIEGAERILPALPQHVSEATAKQLKKLSIQVLTQAKVKAITADGVITTTGQMIPANMKIWAAGIRAPDVLQQLNSLACNKRGQLVVHNTLQTTIDDHIFAFGDCAACPMPDDTGIVPARAQAAHQQAALLAKSILGIITKQHAPLSYHYRDYGSLISLSHHGAVGNLMGKMVKNVFLEGMLARLFYLSLYKMHQIKLHGFWKVLVLTVAKKATKGIKPTLKLH